jgi:GNAT superfamily N-acetyltransferase
VLPAERESRAGFRACLSLNGAPGEALHARLGPSREHIALLRDAGGTIAAGMNFICFPMDAAGGTMTVHTTYVFVAPAWRGRGLLRRVYRTIEDVARDYGRQCGMPDDMTVLFVGEQKDPFRMTLGAFRAADNAYGLDAFDRLAMWGQLGARVLLFRYIQPPLMASGTPDATLFLRVLFREELGSAAPDPAVRGIDPRVLKEHLRRFFGISVAKGSYDPDHLPEVRGQMEDLDACAAGNRTVSALMMPDVPRMTEWKRTARTALAANPRLSGATLGALLGIASVQDAIRRGGGTDHSVATYV